MFTIRKATTEDCALIRKLAQQVFPNTYRDILTPEQIEHIQHNADEYCKISKLYKEIIKVKIPWNAGDISKYWDIAGQDDAISESGRPNDINIR